MLHTGAEAGKAVVAALVAAVVGGVGLARIGRDLIGRQWPGHVEQIVGTEQMDAHLCLVAHGSNDTGVHQYAARVGIHPPAVKVRVDERGVRDAALGADGGARLRDVALQAEAPALVLHGGERTIDHGHGGHADHTTSGIAPQRTGVRADHIDPFRGGEIDVVERRAAIRFGFRHAVQQHAHPAGGAGIAAVARATGTEATDRDADIAGAVARLHEYPWHIAKRVIEPESRLPGELRLVDVRNRQRGRERRLRAARGTHGKRGQRAGQTVAASGRVGLGLGEGVVRGCEPEGAGSQAQQ